MREHTAVKTVDLLLGLFAQIKSLASDIPTLWNATSTTNADRKEIVRCLVERVVVHGRCDSKFVDVTIHCVILPPKLSPAAE